MLKKIKLSINSPREGLLRQTPNEDGIWGNYQFFVNEEIKECDYWVVYSKGERNEMKTIVSSNNVILLTGEPESVYHYAPSFIKKFAVILTSRRDIKHPNVIHIHPAQPWWVGRRIRNDGNIEFVMNFKDLKKTIRNKSKLISVISSSKGFTAGHKSRINFVKKLKEHFGDQIDIYGNGIRGFEDKWDILSQYKYHIVIENSSFEDYWTEKLSDCFLAECFPFYYGCKNIHNYFEEGSYLSIDINDPTLAIQKIEKGISENLYETKLRYIQKAKKLTLEKYNIFPMLIAEIEKLEKYQGKKELIIIKNEKFYLDVRKLNLLMRRFYYKLIYGRI